MTYHSRDLFELSLVSTELFCIRKGEYPYNLVASESSWNLAPDRIAKYLGMGISIEIRNGEESLTNTAKWIADYLKDRAIDVAIFHGPDLLHSMISRTCDVPT